MSSTWPQRYPVFLYSSGDTSLTAFMPSSLSVSEAESFVPRISESKGETDLDGTLHYTFPVNHGFSKVVSDDNKNYRVAGVYNPIDGTLYHSLPYSTLSTGSSYTGTNFSYTAKAQTHLGSYVAARENGVNKLYETNGTPTNTSMTLPAGLSGATTSITGITFHKNYLFLGVQTQAAAANSYRYNIVTSTWQDITGTIFKFGAIRNLLYGVSIHGTIYSVTNEEVAGAATYTLITNAGPTAHASWDYVLNVVSYNGALWISKLSGLYRFDGTSAVQIFTFRPDILTEYNGALFFMYNGWLCRFNGSLFEKLQYFGNSERVVDLQPHANNLYILTAPNISSYKFGGSSNDGSIDYRVFEFDGVNYRVFTEEDSVIAAGMLSSVGDHLLMPMIPNATFSNSVYSFNFANRYTARAAGAMTPYIITADFDADLPNIEKLLRSIEVDVDHAGASDTVTIQYEPYSVDDWIGYSAPITFNPYNQFRNKQIYPPTYALDPVPITRFRRIRLKVKLNSAAASNASLKSVTIHYTVHPRRRRRFNMSFDVIGNDDAMNKQVALDGTDITASAISDMYAINHFLGTTVYGGSYLIGPEMTKLYSDVTSGATSIYVSSDFMWNYESIYTYSSNNDLALFCIINSSTHAFEIFSVSDITTSGSSKKIDVFDRGMFGVQAKAFTAATPCYVFPLVQIGNSRLISDSIIVQPENFPESSVGSRHIKRRLNIELTEL